MTTEDKTCPEDKAETQIVISEPAASCILKSLSKSKLGQFRLDTASANQMFMLNKDDDDLITLDTEFLG